MPGTKAAPAAWMVAMIRSSLVSRPVASGTSGTPACVSTPTRPSASDAKITASAGVGTGATAPSVRAQVPAGMVRLPSPFRRPGVSATRKLVIVACGSQRICRPGNTASKKGQDIVPSTRSSSAWSARGGKGTATRPVKSVPGPVSRQLTTTVIRRRLSNADVSHATLWAPSICAAPVQRVPDTRSAMAPRPACCTAYRAGI